MTVENQEAPIEAQTNEPTENGPSRDELLAALREVGGTESADPAAEQAAAEARAAAPAAPPTPAEPSVDEKLEAMLKKREADYGKRQDAESYADRVRREADEERQRIVEAAREEARRAAAQELADHRARLRGSPIDALRELGTDPQALVDDVLRANTPEGREQARIRAELADAKEGSALAKTLTKELADLKASIQNEKQSAQITQVRNDFLSQHAPPDKTPYLHARYATPEALFDAANEQAKEWQRSGLVLGKDFDASLVAAYLEKQERARISALLPNQQPAHQVRAGAALEAAGSRPQGLANGSRTLSAAAGSERRVSPRPLEELTADQQREELIKEAAAARARNPGSQT